MTRKKVYFILLVVSAVLVLILSACGGSSDENTEEDQDAAITQVVETAMAALSQTAAAQSPTPSLTPTIELPTNTPIPTQIPSNTPGGPTATSSAPSFIQPTNQTSSCDIASFSRDVTIPDGTTVKAGETFTKTWEVENVGTCTWNENYLIVFYDGTQMAEDALYKFTTEDIEPGESVRISVEMTAPTTPGQYTSYWILRNDLGQNFFIDGSSIYAQIEVSTTNTSTPGPSPTPTETGVPNADPVVTIDAPADGATFTTAESVTFTGTAQDAEDDDATLTLEIVWTSNLDGQLGVGAGIIVPSLSEGVHIITASVEDSDGGTATDQITITVNAAP